VTQGAEGIVRPEPWAQAHGIAAACVGLLLLAGTALPVLTQTGPAFSVGANVPPDGPITRAGLATAGRLRGAAPESTADHGRPAPTRTLDINRADGEALQTLPGIGPALARQIVAYREAHGPFRQPADLLRVPGIGVKRYASLEGRIRTAEGP
jgi:competence ComEA-like helix-hairpin-helix protein